MQLGSEHAITVLVLLLSDFAL
eukprot:COSAG02_NODE_11598_length_1691_cov_2.254397_2_plen_21_part_01